MNKFWFGLMVLLAPVLFFWFVFAPAKIKANIKSNRGKSRDTVLGRYEKWFSEYLRWETIPDKITLGAFTILCVYMVAMILLFLDMNAWHLITNL